MNKAEVILLRMYVQMLSVKDEHEKHYQRQALDILETELKWFDECAADLRRFAPKDDEE